VRDLRIENVELKRTTEHQADELVFLRSALEQSRSKGGVGTDHLTPRPDITDPAAGAAHVGLDGKASTKGKSVALEAELARLREVLQQSQEELEAVQEELTKAQNESMPGRQTMMEVAGRLKRKIALRKDYRPGFSWELALESVADVGDKPRPTFIGLGEDSDVPRFLRVVGKIRNRAMPKRDTEALLKEVWREKAKADAEADKALGLTAYLHTFLMKKYGLEAVAKEVGYSFIRSLSKFSYDADCELFLKVLTEEITEDVYKEQMKIMSEMDELFILLDERCNGNKRLGTIPIDDFKIAIKEYFYDKTQEEFEELFESLEEHCVEKHAPDWEGGLVRYASLFEEDRAFDQGPFAEAVRDQHLKQRTQFIDDIETCLISGSLDGTCDMDLVRDVLNTIDPVITAKQVLEYASRGFELPLRTLATLTPGGEMPSRPIKDFIKKLRSGVMHRKAARVNLSDATKSLTTKRRVAPKASGGVGQALKAVASKWQAGMRDEAASAGGAREAREARLSSSPSIGGLSRAGSPAGAPSFGGLSRSGSPAATEVSGPI